MRGGICAGLAASLARVRLPWRRPAHVRIARVGIVLLALSAAGCVSLEPASVRPDAPVGATFPGASRDGSAAPEMAAADIHWFDFYADERLRRLIGIALANNRDLRLAALAVDRARAQYEIAWADRFPGVGIGAVRARQPGPTGGIGNVYNVGLALGAWELDFFGRVRSLGRAAQRRMFASEEGRRAAQISLVAAVANTYLALLADDELIAVTKRALATREDSMRLTELKFRSGVSSELDMQQAISLREAARASLAQLSRQRAADENALVFLLGQPVPPDLPPAAKLQALALAELPPQLPSEVLLRRPDVLAAEQQLLAADANIGAARAAFFPRISLTANAGRASSHLSSLFDGGTGAFTFTAQLLQPLFDAGRIRASLDTAYVDREMAVARYEQAIQAGFREVADVLTARDSYVDQLRAEQAQERAERSRFSLADMRYRGGVASYLEVLDAHRNLLTVQQAVVRTRAAIVQNRIALYRALGGGWTPAQARGSWADEASPQAAAASASGPSRAPAPAATRVVAPIRASAATRTTSSTRAASAARTNAAARTAVSSRQTAGRRAATTSRTNAARVRSTQQRPR